MPVLTAIILIVVGLIVCFFGKRLFRLGLALGGFVVGYYFVAELLLGQSDILVTVGGIIGGLIGAAIFYALYKFNYVLLGIILGLSAATLIGNALNMSGVILYVVSGVLALIGGVIGAVLADPFLRIGTALTGAIQIVGGLGALFAAIGISLPLVNPAHGAVTDNNLALIVSLVLVLILGGIGYTVQSSQDRAAL